MEALSSSTAVSSRRVSSSGSSAFELGDDDAGLVQHDVAERKALRQRLAAHDVADGAVEVGAGVGAGNGTGDEMLGQHHGRGLQHLDVLVGVLLVGLVLHGEHAEHVAAAQDRHRQERVVDLLAGLGPVGESRMVLGVGLVDGHGELGAAPDQALAAHHEGVVHGGRVEALGGEQLERAVLALEVDGADLGHHHAGDLAHDAVEAGLAVRRLGHDLAQPAQDDAQGRLRGRHPRAVSRTIRAPVLHRCQPQLPSVVNYRCRQLSKRFRGATLPLRPQACRLSCPHPARAMSQSP